MRTLINKIITRITHRHEFRVNGLYTEKCACGAIAYTDAYFTA